ncbi:MAG: hypothetical protein WC850_02435 [Candidatus Gracilibacteria bacterium]
MLLLSTSSLKGYGIHRICNFVKKANYDGLDLFMDLSEYDLWDMDYLKEIKNAYQVNILSITASGEGLNKTKVNSILDIAKTLGVQVVTFSPPHITDKDTTWFTRYLQEVKNDFDFNIAVQNVESKYIFFIIPKYKNMPLIETKKITGYASLDIANIDNNSSIDIIKAINMLGNSLKNIYLSDKKADKYGLLPGKERSGISNLPIESFLMQLKSNSYNGFITIKVDPTELGVGNEELILKNLEKVKNYYTKYYLNFK